MTKEEIECICKLVKDLTEIRAKYCNHLSIENFSVDLFRSFLIILHDINKS